MGDKARHAKLRSQREPPRYFAGRARELGALNGRLDDLCETGDPTGGMALVVGVPGVGKTQLVRTDGFGNGCATRDRTGRGPSGRAGGDVSMFNYETACVTDIGGREEQQDRAAVFAARDARLLVVADGVGGHTGGELASQTVIEVANEAFVDFERDEPPARLLERIAFGAHERINILGGTRGLNAHTTCVLLYVDAHAAAWAHVGDSRLYRFEGGGFVERTLDHSIVELMHLQGRITEEEMKTHPDKNRLYEALGGGQRPQVEAGGKQSGAGDGFLLLSDGVWENVANADLEAVFQADDLIAALARLIQQAKAQGGPGCDNMAAAVARATIPSTSA